MLKSAREAKSAIVESQVSQCGNTNEDYPTFELGDHPSEVMARRAVWSWMRRRWLRRLRRKPHHDRPEMKYAYRVGAGLTA